MERESIKLNKYKEYIISHTDRLLENDINQCKTIDEVEEILKKYKKLYTNLEYSKFYRHYLSHNDIKISDKEINTSDILYLGSVKLFIPFSQYGFNLTHKICYKMYFEYKQNMYLIQCSDEFDSFKFKGLEECPKFIKDNIVSFLTNNREILNTYFKSNTRYCIKELLNMDINNSLNFSNIENYHNF